MKIPRFRACLVFDMAFIYDPLMLESNEDSVLIGWGTPKHKHFMRESVKNHGQEYGCRFHTFAYPRQFVSTHHMVGVQGSHEGF